MGIGSAIALSFAEAGADVAICDIVVEGGGMESLVNEIKQLGRRSLAVQTDVTKKSDVDNLVKRVMDEFGFIDILVNCAGGGPPRPAFLEMPEEHWDTLMDVNCKRSELLRHVLGDRWSEPEVMKQAAERVPLGYIAEPQDVANLALFLASDASRCITGVVVALDGGSSLVGRRRN